MVIVAKVPKRGEIRLLRCDWLHRFMYVLSTVSKTLCETRRIVEAIGLKSL